jgi:copper(I)-binding protein
MFLDVKEGPKRGAPVKGTLVFEKAGRIEVEYAVEPVGAREPSGGAGTGKDDAKSKAGHSGH